MHCPPWELVEDPEDTGWTPREFWRVCALIYANAQGDHAKRQEEAANRGSSQGGAGRPAGGVVRRG